jgi:DNA-binding transcriptional MerR regulator
MAADLVIRINASATQALQEIKRVQGQIAGMSKITALSSAFSAVSAGVTAAVAAVNTVVSAVSEFVAAGREAAAIDRELASAIADVGARYGVTVAQVGEYAKNLSVATNYSVGEIKAVGALMVRFGLYGDVLDRAMQLSADLAAAMGTDLKGAAEMLGRALVNPEGATKRLASAGIQLSQQQREVIESLVETGRVAEAQSMILSALESRYGTAAEAAADPLMQLQNQLSDIKEVVGDMILTVIRPFAEAFTPILRDVVLPALEQAAQDLKEMGPYVRDVARGAAEVARVLMEQAVPALKRTWSVLQWVSPSIMLFRLLREALAYIGKKSNDAKDAVEATAAAAQNAFEGAAAGVNNFADALSNAEFNARKLREQIRGEVASKLLEARFGREELETQRFIERAQAAGFTAHEIMALLGQLEEAKRIEAERAAAEKAQQEAQRRAQQDAEDVARRAERIRESIKTDEQRMREELSEARDLYLRGALSREEYAAFIEKQRQQLVVDRRTMEQPLPRYAAAVAGGLRQAFSAVLAAMRPQTQRDPQEKTAKNTEKLVAIFEQFLGELRAGAI